ncbi:MAG: L,D-transpeptidase family protein [Bacteroidetes bacterium]|nr:L,D-transpeptidase family protein [Bacteroidota bacterium]
MKNILILTSFLFLSASIYAQPVLKGGANSYSFINYQKSFPRPSDAMKRKLDTLQKQFSAAGLKWPAKYIYIRSFKFDAQLEVWVKDEISQPFKLFKTYRVCALAGTLGPKRMEGDYQVPEGFYYINVFNPQSNYYLSLGLNYPNLSDKILSDSLRPGSEIYIHGSCVTVGCIPITDQQIDELYILASYAKDQGQDFIPVHVFPIRYNKATSVQYLESLTKDDKGLKKFAGQLEGAYDYFEKYKQLPVVMIGPKGEYLINDVPEKKIKEEVVLEKKTRPKRNIVQHKVRNNIIPEEFTHQWPVYGNATNDLQQYITKLGKELEPYLPDGITKAYLQVEFIIDKDGEPVNFKVLKGTKDEDLIDELITRMEKMGKWKPATLNEKPVAKKMIQTVVVE